MATSRDASGPALRGSFTQRLTLVSRPLGENVLLEQPEEIRPALERAFDSGKAACVNVEIERDYNFKCGVYV